MSITFDRSLVTGNELIDTQHRELISRVNKLAEECVPGTEKRTAVNTRFFAGLYGLPFFRGGSAPEKERVSEAFGPPPGA